MPHFILTGDADFIESGAVPPVDAPSIWDSFPTAQDSNKHNKQLKTL